MNVNTENSVSITEANRNFSCVAHSASDEDIIALLKLIIEKKERRMRCLPNDHSLKRTDYYSTQSTDS